ncbi:MAG: hypothetical protein ACKOC4_05020, partial [Planctomycetia bacterium]
GRFGVTPADVFNGNQIAIRPEVQQLIDDLNARTRPQPVAAPGPAVATGQPLQQFQVPLNVQPVNQPAQPLQPIGPPAAQQPPIPQPIPTGPPTPSPTAGVPPLVPVR